MRRATASVFIFHTQVFLVYLQYISAKTHSKCAWQPQIAKNHLKPIFWGLKVIDVGTTGKLIGSACYDKQQVCVYLQPFSR